MRRRPEVWRTRRGSCVQSQGRRAWKTVAAHEWACVDEGVMEDSRGALRGVVSSRGRRQGMAARGFCCNICMT